MEKEISNQEVEVIEDEKPKDNTVDNSTIKQMREQIKVLKQENETLKANTSQVEELQKQMQALQEKDLVQTYGQENLEDAKKLLQAGFDETKIKSMLNKTDDLSIFDNKPTEDPNIKDIKGNGEVKEEDDSKNDFEEQIKKQIEESKL